MRVTDEQVAIAMAVFEAYFQDPAHERQCDECKGEGCTPVGVDADRDWCPKCGGPGTLNDATEEGGIRAALESFALSHAAGQEAVAMVYTMEPLVPGGHISYHASMRRAVPAGTLLYDHPAQPPASAEVGYPEAAEVCGEAYQVVGCLLDQLGLFDTPEAEKILDNLSQHRMVHRDVLPWTIGPAPSAQAVAVAVDDAAIERFAAAYYGRGKTYEPERVRAALQAALSPIAGVTHGTDEGWGDE